MIFLINLCPRFVLSNQLSSNVFNMRPVRHKWGRNAALLEALIITVNFGLRDDAI